MMQRPALIRLAAFAALVAVACDPAPSRPEYAATDTTQPALVTADAAPAPEPCGTVFTPTPELLEETTRVAARWAAATGCDVRVGEHGVPVVLVDVIPGHAPEDPGWGHTSVLADGSFQIEVTAFRFEDRIAGDAVLTHEVGHVLNLRGDHLDCVVDDAGAQMLKTGPVMCTIGGAGLITAADLEYVCEGYPCAAFEPESP
jgi:hypothetical protein